MRYTFKRLLIGLAIIFATFALTKLWHHDLYTALWSAAVSLALILGLLPRWLTEPIRKPGSEPERYRMT